MESLRREAIPDLGAVIVHADMDAFYASVEELDNPDLAGKPVAVGGSTQRGVVATSNYHARQFGVRSATPMAIALRRCPELTIVRPRMERYKEISRIVMDAFKTFTSLIEPLSLDEAFLDMTTAMSTFATPEHMGGAIQRAVFEATGGLTVLVGLATTKLVAKIASDFRKPNGLTVVHPDEVIRFLSPLPVSSLWGVGPKAVERLHRLELKTIGDIAKASDTVLGQLGPTDNRIGALLWVSTSGPFGNAVVQRVLGRHAESGSTYRGRTPTRMSNRN